jgi:hypothetical protein
MRHKEFYDIITMFMPVLVYLYYVTIDARTGVLYELLSDIT